MVGVLVAWSNSAPFATEAHKQRLQPFAHLAAAKIAMWHSEQDRQRIETELRDSEALYHSLVENLPQCLYRKGLDEKFTVVNEAFCRYSGRPREFILGKTDFDLYAMADASQFQNDDKVLLEGSVEKIEKEETNEPLATGQVHTVHVVKLPVADSARNLIGTQGVFWDVTAEKQAQRELQDYYDFTFHSFGNELLQLHGSLHFAKRLERYFSSRQLTVPSELAKLVKFFELGVGALSFYLMHLRKFLRGELVMKPQKIAPMVETEVWLLGEAASDELTPKFDLQVPAGTTISCDAEFFVAAVKELLRNSRKSIFRRRENCKAYELPVEQGSVRVTISFAPGDDQIPDRHLQVVIADNGDAAAFPEARERLRNVWKNLLSGKQKNESKKGLSFVNWVIQKHGGYAELDKSVVESTVKIHLPVIT